MPEVKLFGILRQHAGGLQMEFTGNTVRIILQELCDGNPDLCADIFSLDQTGLRPHIRILLNGRDIEMLQGFETQVSDSDTLVIIPPIAGGSDNIE